MYSVYFDGASRSNPGPASYGGVIYDDNNNEIATYKKYIGKHTNNVAEYLGCFHGVQEIGPWPCLHGLQRAKG